MSALGSVYADGDVIVREGEVGNCMYVIQEGQVEVLVAGDRETRVSVLEAGDFFGEMALVDRVPRSATVRAMGPARILTVDKKMFLRRVQEDPTLALRILERMSQRIRALNETIAGSS